jgi:hypothetical protein
MRLSWVSILNWLRDDFRPTALFFLHPPQYPVSSSLQGPNPTGPVCRILDDLMAYLLDEQSVKWVTWYIETEFKSGHYFSRQLFFFSIFISSFTAFSYETTGSLV